MFSPFWPSNYVTREISFNLQHYFFQGQQKVHHALHTHTHTQCCTTHSRRKKESRNKFWVSLPDVELKSFLKFQCLLMLKNLPLTWYPRLFNSLFNINFQFLSKYSWNSTIFPLVQLLFFSFSSFLDLFCVSQLFSNRI